jgi:hypothetical protein
MIPSLLRTVGLFRSLSGPQQPFEGVQFLPARLHSGTDFLGWR